MKVKAKKCKGTGRAKGHGCGKESLKRIYGLCMTCYPKWLLNTDEGKELIKKRAISASRQTKREQAKKKREFNEANKSIAKLKLEARAVFQKWIRLRDIDDKCICCSKDSETWDAGHYMKAEIYSGVIFDEINVNKQRVYCNQWLHGNESEYRKGLIKKYGKEKVQELEKRAIETRNYKWTREELNEIKNKYKQKIKDYESKS